MNIIIKIMNNIEIVLINWKYREKIKDYQF